MITGARKLPTQHLSIRAPWHDSGWAGTVCTRPDLNGACRALSRIAEQKDDAAEADPDVAGKSLEALDRRQLPPCLDERAFFMASFPLTLHKTHPYASQNPDLAVRGLERDAQVNFTQWREEVSGLADRLGINATRAELQWLWESIRHEPRLSGSRSLFVDNHLQKREVLPEGSRLVIRLGDKAKQHAEDPEPKIVLLGPLFMGDRKRGRAECYDVKAELRMKVRRRSSDVEARAMGLEDKDRIRHEDGVLCVDVDSLNEAYTKASMRLETWRRSHGGRVYDHLFWLGAPNDVVSLAYIREQVEEGKWELPRRPETEG